MKKKKVKKGPFVADWVGDAGKIEGQKAEKVEQYRLHPRVIASFCKAEAIEKISKSC